jgi:hypothetical protein
MQTAVLPVGLELFHYNSPCDSLFLAATPYPTLMQ